MSQYVLWAVIILALNACNTALTRARSSGSLVYHTVMASIAGLVWIFNQLLSVNILVDIWHHRNWLLFTIIGVFYVVLTAIGSVGSHWLLVRFIESGKAQVGQKL